MRTHDLRNLAKVCRYWAAYYAAERDRTCFPIVREMACDGVEAAEALALTNEEGAMFADAEMRVP